MAETKTTEAAEAAEAPEVAPKPRRRITRRKQVEAQARAYWEAIAARDPEAVAGQWSEDGVDEIVPVGVLRGPGEIAAFFRELFAAAPDLETTVTRLVAGERQAAVEWRMTGHFTGAPFQGLEPNGRRFEVRGLDLMEFEEGRLTRNTGYYDGMAFARQIGLMPPQDSGAERAMKGAFNAAIRARRAVADWRSSR
jgi:steroid delta-isomerase-like uncharacterized protein